MNHPNSSSSPNQCRSFAGTGIIIGMLFTCVFGAVAAEIATHHPAQMFGLIGYACWSLLLIVALFPWLAPRFLRSLRTRTWCSTDAAHAFSMMVAIQAAVGFASIAAATWGSTPTAQATLIVGTFLGTGYFGVATVFLVTDHWDERSEPAAA